MPDYKISIGLPELPPSLDNKQFQLVAPLYSAINTLARAVAGAVGAVDWKQGELAERNQLASVLTQNHRKLHAKNVTGATLGYGKIVNLYLDTGKIAAQHADATDNTKPAHGIVNVPLGIADGDFGEIMLIEGYSQGISGTTFGAYYYLSSNGDVQIARPGTAGSIVQPCGFGLGSAGFYLHISSYFHQN